MERAVTKEGGVSIKPETADSGRRGRSEQRGARSQSELPPGAGQKQPHYLTPEPGRTVSSKVTASLTHHAALVREFFFFLGGRPHITVKRLPGYERATSIWWRGGSGEARLQWLITPIMPPHVAQTTGLSRLHSACTPNRSSLSEAVDTVIITVSGPQRAFWFRSTSSYRVQARSTPSLDGPDPKNVASPSEGISAPPRTSEKLRRLALTDAVHEHASSAPHQIST